jgi:hypothetical protein
LCVSSYGDLVVSSYAAVRKELRVRKIE